MCQIHGKINWKVPIIKNVAGANVIIVSDSDKGIYDQIDKTSKKNKPAKETNGNSLLNLNSCNLSAA